jgi:hypothetical protein
MVVGGLFMSLGLLPSIDLYRDPQLASGLSHVERSMAEFMNQIKMMSVHRLSSFIYDCFLTRAASMGVDPALNLESDSGGSGSNCFIMSCGSAGSWPASDVDDDLFSCSTNDSAGC